MPRFIPIADRRTDKYLRNMFTAHIPATTMISEDHGKGQFEAEKKRAVFAKELQPNSKLMTWAITIDVDRKMGLYADVDSEYLVPRWNIASVNPKNGHAHLTYLLQSPVSHGATSHQKPQALLEKIQRKLTLALGGDVAYNRKLTYNPLHAHRHTYVNDNPAYQLMDLAEELDDVKLPLRKVDVFKPSDMGGVIVGERNVQLFNTLRMWAYKYVGTFSDEEQHNFEIACNLQAHRFNHTMHVPLDMGEVHQVFKSVFRWVWRRREQLASRVGGYVKKAVEHVTLMKQKANILSRISRVEDGISRVYNAVKETGSTVGKVLAQATGYSERTIRRYRKHINMWAEKLAERGPIDAPIAVSAVNEGADIYTFRYLDRPASEDVANGANADSQPETPTARQHTHSTATHNHTREGAAEYPQKFASHVAENDAPVSTNCHIPVDMPAYIQPSRQVVAPATPAAPKRALFGWIADAARRYGCDAVDVLTNYILPPKAPSDDYTYTTDDGDESWQM